MHVTTSNSTLVCTITGKKKKTASERKKKNREFVLQIVRKSIYRRTESAAHVAARHSTSLCYSMVQHVSLAHTPMPFPFSRCTAERVRPLTVVVCLSISTPLCFLSRVGPLFADKALSLRNLRHPPFTTSVNEVYAASVEQSLTYLFIFSPFSLLFLFFSILFGSSSSCFL